METDLVAARVRAQVAVTTATEALGRHHPETAGALLTLAEAARRLGDLDEAESAYRRAIAILQTQPAPDPAVLGVALGDLGALLLQQGRLDDAEHALVRAQALLEDAVGPDHPHATSLRARRRALEGRRGRIPY